jgi:hypothetical protein
MRARASHSRGGLARRTCDAGNRGPSPWPISSLASPSLGWSRPLASLPSFLAFHCRARSPAFPVPDPVGEPDKTVIAARTSRVSCPCLNRFSTGSNTARVPTESQNDPGRASFSACRAASVIGYRWRFKARLRAQQRSGFCAGPRFADYCVGLLSSPTSERLPSIWRTNQSVMLTWNQRTIASRVRLHLTAPRPF